MATEILAIKEDYLEEFIDILECGIIQYESAGNEIPERLLHSLQTWITNEKEYVNRLNGE